MRSRKMIALLVGILGLATWAIVVELNRKPDPYITDTPDQPIVVVRIPSGAELFIPSGTSMIPMLELTFNDHYQVSLQNITAGVHPIPKGQMVDESGNPMPDSEEIRSAAVVNPNVPTARHVFIWR